MSTTYGKFGASLGALVIATLHAAPAEAKPIHAITAGILGGPGQPGDTGSSLTPYYRNINPFYRNIGAFWGDINPFYRNIGAFWGDVNPFYRNIGAFWGDLNPLYRNVGAFSGAVFPDYRNIGAFWDATGDYWSTVDTQWGLAGSYASQPGAYMAIRDQLSELSTRSEAVWGAAVASQTGKSFTEGFAKPLFAKYGIDLSNPASLEGLPANERSHFFLDWYDGLMNFAGTDHVDWWMKTANWTPHLTQVQGSGRGTTIGLIDFFVAGDADIKSKTVFYDGVSNFSNGHGAGVASLMVSAHDGQGIMGIAPNAKIAAYNPFDASGTADWPDITRGIVKVTGAGASVVNLSLGVPGWTLNPDWRGVFNEPAVAAVKNKTVYVIAAGNDGSTQTQGVNWGGAARDTSLILVGAVDPTGTISEFSNRPGDACLLKDDGKCDVKLKDRFIVAPGELILVSDDAGGVARRSGTSFAAPLVSGAIALLHDRWPWLKNYAKETADIILGSAKDLGAPGTDATYGVGLLDVTASQSPLSFDKLAFYQVDGLLPIPVRAADLKRGGVQASWETRGLYLTAFEKIGGTQRDFQIPLSSRLAGLSAANGEQFQDYVYSRLVDWMESGKKGFSDFQRTSAPVANSLGLNLTMTAGAANPASLRYSRQGAPIQSALRLDAPSGRLGLTVGQGDGAIALGGRAGFGLFTDYDAQSGGANPMLGFASGGAYAAMSVTFAPGLNLSVGATERRRDRQLDLIGVESAMQRAAYAGLARYRASAAHVTIDYRLSPAMNVTAAFTSLDEPNGLLGVRSAEPGDLRGGSRSDAATLGADVSVGSGLTFTAAATVSKTRSGGRNATLQADGLLGTSYQLAIAKEHVLGASDRLRLSIAQPLTIESGSVDYKSVQVVDRETGEIGVVTDHVDVASRSRRFVAETIYGLSLMDGRAELSAFGRGQVGRLAAEEARYTIGGRWRLSF